jgi:hypothetical protein
MRSLLIGLALAGAAHAAEPHPALYSFDDVYRLTVNGPVSHLAAPDTIRVALSRPEPAGPEFSVAREPRRETWLLIVAGVAFAGWVAHRRLSHLL